LIKPFIYLAALEHGIEPNTIFEDKPIAIYQGPGLPLYSPKNFGNNFLGYMTMRTGLEKSRNTITVQLAKMIGLGSVAELIQRYGINDNPKKFYSMALGALETNLDKVTSAFGSIANGCNKITPEFIEMIKDRNGKIIYRRDKGGCKGCVVSEIDLTKLPIISNYRTQKPLTDEASCYQITSMLEGAAERGTVRSAKKLSKTLAGKTGTTNDSMDTWFVGFTPRIVSGTYIGYDHPTPMGQKATGATVCLPVFIKLMENPAFQKEPSIDFVVPKSVTLIQIDAKTGKQVFDTTDQTITEALKSANINHLPNIVEDEPDDTDPFKKLDVKQKFDQIEVY
jgi:penicillin-binding protein 1A